MSARRYHAASSDVHDVQHLKSPKSNLTYEETNCTVQSSADLETLVRYTNLSPETPPVLLSCTQLQSVATHVTETPQVGTERALEALENVRFLKRPREHRLILSTRDEDTESSDDGALNSKKLKVECDCDTDHSWWMTIKIGELNEVLQRIDAALGIVRNVTDHPNDLDKIASGNIADLLADSQGILESAKDDMRAEGGRDKETSE